MALLSATCGSGGAPYYEGGEIDLYCRDNPRDCFGEIGGDCGVTEDCIDGNCCRDKECGNGMCTYFCDGDFDCPDVMNCEHGYCFFRCSDDDECGPGQKCEHSKTVCEYE